MAKIKSLSETVSNKISAGEVIERPASVVKELVENSIDSESDMILIEVLNGGKDKIRVKDNGTGIEEDDLELAFSRYATSKIKNINDLYSIKTLGFRGEALASIAAVSRVEASSRSTDSLKGKYLKLEGGKVIKKETVGISCGTDIVVRELFYNTPARLKYMKTINTEFGHISNIINREALAYPEIRFTLVHNDNKVFKTPGSSKLIDVIYSIFNNEVVENSIPLKYEDRFIKLEGYISSPDFHRSSRIHEYFFVNKRAVYNNLLCKGVEEGYHGLLPSGKYPIVFINIKLNQILVDVNVHPTKREIKFSRGKIIKDVLRKGIRKTLEINNPATKIKLESENKGKKIKHIKKEKLFSEIDEKTINKNGIKSSHDYLKEEKTKYNQGHKGVSNEINEMEKKVFPVEEHSSPKKYSILNKERRDADEERKYSQAKDKSKIIKEILGQINNTYIIVTGIDGIYIIDQHNAHERVIYEKLYKDYNKREIKSQTMFHPVNIELTLSEIEIIKKHLTALNDIGLKFEPFGGKTYLLQEIPVILKNKPVKETIRELIDKIIKEGKTGDRADIIKNTISCLSCKSAIKAGKKMAEKEMEELVVALFKTKNPYRCPHGRPIIIHLSEKEINKKMGRY